MKFGMLALTERIYACGISVRDSVGKWQLGRSIIWMVSLECTKGSILWGKEVNRTGLGLLCSSPSIILLLLNVRMLLLESLDNVSI